MASSVESRVPFLTTEIAEFIFSLPEEYIIDATGTTKSIFREAMRGIVPDPVLDRQDKIGFATSEPTWLRTLWPMLKTVLESDTAAAIPALNRDAMRREADAVLGQKQPVGLPLWRWLSVVFWAEQYSVSFES